MPIPLKQTIQRVERPDWFGATSYSYSNYLDASTDVIAAGYFADDSFNFAERDLMWCKLSDGYFTLRFTSPTTAVIATD